MDQVINYLQKVQNDDVQKSCRELIQAPEMMQQDFNQNMERAGEDEHPIFLTDKFLKFYEQKFLKMVNNLETRNFADLILQVLQFEIIPNDFIIQQMLFFLGSPDQATNAKTSTLK